MQKSKSGVMIIWVIVLCFFVTTIFLSIGAKTRFLLNENLELTNKIHQNINFEESLNFSKDIGNTKIKKVFSLPADSILEIFIKDLSSPYNFEIKSLSGGPYYYYIFYINNSGNKEDFSPQIRNIFDNSVNLFLVNNSGNPSFDKGILLIKNIGNSGNIEFSDLDNFIFPKIESFSTERIGWRNQIETEKSAKENFENGKILEEFYKNF